MKNINVKKWYKEMYQNDELGKNINSKISFEDVCNILDSYGDFYKLIGVYDSIVRERIFEKLSQISNHTYNEIYNKWLQA